MKGKVAAGIKQRQQQQLSHSRSKGSRIRLEALPRMGDQDLKSHPRLFSLQLQRAAEKMVFDRNDG
jgi:hypothetical protein